jgi:hypothetical protein
MSAKAKHYFVYGNTAQGFVSKLDSNLTGIEKLCILHGRPGTGKLLMTAASRTHAQFRVGSEIPSLPVGTRNV